MRKKASFYLQYLSSFCRCLSKTEKTPKKSRNYSRHFLKNHLQIFYSSLVFLLRVPLAMTLPWNLNTFPF
jgi:hypothetical protein